MSPERPLVLVGAGKMGGALLDGWLAAGRDPRTIVIVDPSPALVDSFTRPGLRLETTPPDLPASVLVIAVKPQVMRDVLPTLAPLRDSDTVLISVAAGITVDTLASLGAGPIVRAIPNTPAAVSKGATAAFGHDLSAEQRTLADTLLKAIGMVTWVDDEALIDVATAVSGSGPAYVFHLVECLAKAGEAEGLAPETAMALARQTIVGAGALLDRSDLDPATLRRNVTSPGGTTAAALEVMMRDGGSLEALMGEAVAAAAKRSRELA